MLPETELLYQKTVQQVRISKSETAVMIDSSAYSTAITRGHL